jgi:Trp operon repressor
MAAARQNEMKLSMAVVATITRGSASVREAASGFPPGMDAI